jgi:uncharacterized protein (DUF433 family)
MAIVKQEYVEIDELGVARIIGTPYSVLAVAAEWLATGDPPDWIAGRFADVTAAQVLGALAYYYEHKSELDAQIADEATAESDGERDTRIIAVNRAAWLKRAGELRCEHHGMFGAIADGRFLGVAPTLQEAEALVDPEQPSARLALVFSIERGPVTTPFYSISSYPE